MNAIDMFEKIADAIINAQTELNNCFSFDGFNKEEDALNDMANELYDSIIRYKNRVLVSNLLISYVDKSDTEVCIYNEPTTRMGLYVSLDEPKVWWQHGESVVCIYRFKTTAKLIDYLKETWGISDESDVANIE